MTPSTERRRRRGQPAPSATRARGCTSPPASVAHLLAEELLTVRETFRVDALERPLRETARLLLGTVLARGVPEAAVRALQEDLRAPAARGVFTMTDVEVRLWFLGWTLHGAAGPDQSARSV